MSNGTLPGYIAAAKPVPAENRQPWYKNTAPTYAGIFLWFVFWDNVANGGETLSTLGGTLSCGVGTALLGLVIAAALCHYLFYLVPGLLGMKTGLPLYIVGTSTYGTQGGFVMPGFLMGVLQFGWLGVNAFFSTLIIYNAFAGTPIDLNDPNVSFPVPGHAILAVLWAAGAAFMGLKGIQYVAKINTYLPLIPLGILTVLFVAAVGGFGAFDPDKMAASQKLASAAKPLADPLTTMGVLMVLITYVTGFFATAGAAGVDFGQNNRNAKDVQMGGLVGIALAIVVTAGFCVLIAAGAQGKGMEGTALLMKPTALLTALIGKQGAAICMVLLAVAAFPPACFSSFIAANSFKTTLPKVPPFVSVGIGTIVSIVLAAFGLAGKVVPVFLIIGASFGPICGAMVADYLLSGRKWAGPRKGINWAGYISWAVGFVVAILPMLKPATFGWITPAPVIAFVIGFVLYAGLAKAGLEPATVPMEPSK